jgi:transcriptional regulator with XRE-family HTH domain
MEFHSEKIRMLRKKNHLSQQALGELSGIDQRQLSRYETGVNVPTKKNLHRLASALNVPERIFFT